MHLFIFNMTLGNLILTVFCHPHEFLIRKFVSYGWAFNIVYVTEDCILLMTDQNEYFYVIFMILFCIFPVTSSLFISIYLFRLTFQKRIVPATSSQVDMTIFRNKIKSLVFIFATTAWTSFSLLPYRIFNLCRIGLFDWNTMGCEQRHLMNWLAWILLYLLIVNPIVNPLITAIIYTPYRISIKRMMINILNCNRYRYQKEIIDTSSLSMSRTLSRSSSSTFDHEMASLCPVNEVTSSPNFNYAACTTPSTEETSEKAILKLHHFF
uniref:G-protein coupled receptors family 1 profile domain-containing protein n=1 Tax=Acrobeloides nanus TaxID=290746 RepID=A0A914ECV4_9BILA